MPTADIRVIDLGGLTGGSQGEFSDADVQRVADEVNQAFQANGFLILQNHGVPQHVIQQLRQAATQFFLQTSNDVKAKCSYRAPVPRGYSGNRKENFAILAGNQRPNDLVEKYRMGPWQFDKDESYFTATKDAQMMYFPNKWPETDTFGLQPAMETYYSAMENLMKLLFRIFERCLQLPDGFFVDKIDKHASILSVNHYPPVLKQVQKGQLRLAEHTDVDLFTILCPDWEDCYSCLEVKQLTDGEWTAVPILPNSLVINIGDCLNYWTNGHWLSTCHRVIVPPTKVARSISRIAIGYFVAANYDAPITNLPSSCSELKGDVEPTTYTGWRKARVQQALDSLAKN